MSATRRLNGPHLKGFWRLNSRADDYSGYGNNGTWSGTEAYADGPMGRTVGVFNGTTAKVSCGDIGTIRAIALSVNPTTTTEELVLVDTGKDIMVSGGTITYTGLTPSATYVDGELSTTLVAGVWQHVVCVLNADVSAATFQIGTDGSNFGAGSIAGVRALDIELSGDEAKALYSMERRGL